MTYLTQTIKNGLIFAGPDIEADSSYEAIEICKREFPDCLVLGRKASEIPADEEQMIGYVKRNQ